MMAQQSLNLEVAFTSGGNNTPDLDTSLHGEEKCSSWVAGILDLNTQMIKTTALVCCYVTRYWTVCVPGKHNGLQGHTVVFQETNVNVSQTGVKGGCCSQSVSAGRKEERKGGGV